MGDEKKEGQEKKGDNSTFKEIRAGSVVAIAVTFIVAVVLFPLHIIRIDIITMFGSASWIVASLIFGLIVGLIYYLAPSKSKSTWAILTFVVVIIILGLTGGLQLGFLQGPVTSVSSFFKSSFGSVGDAFACLNPQSEKCLANMGNGGDINQGSSDTATVSFSGNEIKGGQASTIVKIIYDNKEDTTARVTPKCSVGEDKETTQDISIQSMNPPKDGEDFLFPANKKTSTSLKCAGTVPECKVVAPCNRNLFFSLTRDAKVTGDSWRFYLNQESSPELKVDTSQPYYATIDYVGSDTVLLMPDTEIYPQVKIIRTDTKDELKKVNYLRLTFPEQVSMQCDHFLSTAGGIELKNTDLGWLNQNVKTGDNEYSFDCTLKVGSEAMSVQQIIVTINSEYNVEAIFGPYLLKEAKQPA